MARSSMVSRETGETVVKVELDLDGRGQGEVQTGLPFFVPMDEALAQVAVDLGGRGYAQIDAPIGDAEGIKGDLIAHFLESLAREGRFNLHAQVRGQNDNHKAEALFKALARALASATRIEKRRQGRPPSTKGVID